VVVFVLYGGNDFLGVMVLERYFHRRGAPHSRSLSEEHLARIGESATYAISQEIGQVLYFLANPEDEVVAVDTTTAIAAEVLARCSSMGAKLLCVYLPPPGAGQPDPGLAYLAPALERYELTSEQLGISDRLADSWLGSLQERGIQAVDLRPTFLAAHTPCYWRRDLHLDVDGHRLVAGVLSPVVLRLTE
jgi:hypothetical protein